MKLNRLPRLLRVYLITYSAVLLIPTIVLAMIINFLALPSLRREMIDRNSESLTISANQIDLIMDNLDLLANQISSNPNLTPYVMNSGKSYEGLRILRLLSQLNYTISDIIYYAHGSDKIFTTETVTDIDTFPNLFYKKWDADFFTHELSGLSTKKIIPIVNNNGSELLAVIYPVGGNMSYLTLIFILDRESLASLIRKNRNIYDEKIIIFDRNNQPLIRIFPGNTKLEDNSWEMENLRDIINMSSTGLTQNTLKKKFITLLNPEKGDFKFLSIIEKSVFLKPFKRIQWYFSCAMLLIMALGFTVIIIFSRRQYDPIHRLAEKTSPWGVGEDDNELAGIDAAIDGLLFSHRELTERTSRFRLELRSRIIKDLISEGAAEKISGTDLVFPDRAICFNCLIYKGEYSELTTLVQVNQMLEEKSPGKAALMEMERRSGNFLVLTLAELDIEGDRRDLARQIGFILFGDNPYVVGVGTPCDDLLNLRDSYLSACDDGGVKISVQPEASPLGYDFDQLEELKLHIREGDAEKVQTIIKSFVDQLSSQHQSPYLLHYFLLDLSAVIIRLVFDQEIAFTDIKENLNNLIELENIDDSDQEQKNLKILGVCLAMCDCINENRKRNNRLMESAMALVEEKKLDQNFSVELLADELNVTVPYLSQYIKKKTGKTLVSHIWDYRLSEAKRLLVEGDLPVKDVVFRVGYFDNSSFTRRFRKETGFSPQEYRREYGKHNV